MKRFTGKISAASPVQLTIGTFEGGYTAIANKNTEKPAAFAMPFDGEAERLDIETGRFAPLDTARIEIGPGDMALIRTK